MSPIYGITERGLRFPRLGSIRKGEQIPMMKDGQPVKRGNEVVMRPVERPWFVFSCDAMTAQYVPTPGLSKKDQKQEEIKHQEMEYKLQQETLERIYSVYGTNQITELNVFLPYPEAHNAFSFWLEAYVSNQKVAQSDERIITFLFDTLTGEVLVRRGMVVRHSSNPNSVAGSLVKEIPIGGSLPYEKDMIVGETRTKNEPITMKPVGRLNVVIPELKQAATWMVFTGAWADIGSIYSAVETIDQIQKSMGQPANTVPLILRRVPVQKSYEDENGKTHKKTYYDIEAKIMSNAVKGLLTMYEETPFMMQLSSGQDEDYGIPDESLEPVEAQVEEFEEPAESIQEPMNRPFSPEALKDWFDTRSRYYAEHKTEIYAKGAQVVAKALKIALPDDTDRYAFTGWITGNPSGSTKSLKTHEILAFAELMDIDVTGKAGFGQLPSTTSVKEIQYGLEFSNALKGQQKLEI